MPRWVTVFGRVSHLGAEPGTQAYSAWACPLCRLDWVHGESWESKQAYRVTHQPVSVHSVFAECLAGGWLAEISADLREAVAHEACSRRCAIQIHNLLYFTYLTTLHRTVNIAYLVILLHRYSQLLHLICDRLVVSFCLVSLTQQLLCHNAV